MGRISKKYLDSLYQKTTLHEAMQIKDAIKTNDEFHIFLSYPYENKEYAIKIYKLLIKFKYKVYIDLKDEELDRRERVDKETAERISSMMDKCQCLIYVHTKSAQRSKWCPWELGYMSGKKGFKCATILLTDDQEEFPREEFLQMYPYVDVCVEKNTNGKERLWVNELDSDKYTTLDDFMNGGIPHEHKKQY